MVAVATPSMSPTPPSATSLPLMQIVALLSQPVPGCLGITPPPLVCITWPHAGAGTSENRAAAKRPKTAYQVRLTRTALAIIRQMIHPWGQRALHQSPARARSTARFGGFATLNYIEGNMRVAKLTVLLWSGLVACSGRYVSNPHEGAGAEPGVGA